MSNYSKILGKWEILSGTYRDEVTQKDCELNLKGTIFQLKTFTSKTLKEKLIEQINQKNDDNYEDDDLYGVINWTPSSSSDKSCLFDSCLFLCRDNVCFNFFEIKKKVFLLIIILIMNQQRMIV
jgi:hypothetical protein